jgi:hypothetical protein
MRDLQSNDAALEQIAQRTGGRVLPAFDPTNADLFNRIGVAPAIAPLPIWDTLLPILVALILLDVAARRIAWDWVAIKRYAATATGAVRGFTTIRKVETRGSLDALQRVRSEGGSTELAAKPATPPVPSRPRSEAKFEAKIDPAKPAADITQSVGGATDKPIPTPPKNPEPKGTSGGMGSLMEAKRRAQQKIREKEQGDQKPPK